MTSAFEEQAKLPPSWLARIDDEYAAGAPLRSSDMGGRSKQPDIATGTCDASRIAP